jgi:glycosyltransferase involved in cell wall biosynthesis
MACFPSQFAEQPYDQRITGLNRFRSYFLGPAAEAAEAFMLLEANSIQPGLAPLFEGPLVHRRKSGFATSPTDIPLVSIIIRSMDRPVLSRALDSVALQTWPHIEVVVVNAKGGGHTQLPDYCGRFPLRVVNQGGASLPRSRAANAGLAACRGDYLCFLDDDDSMDADHLYHLVETLQKRPKPCIAYAGVRGLNEQSPREVIAEFSEPEVSFTRLLLGNVVPIHAVLFPAELARQGVQFDEAFDQYEDWDFWLQLARRAPFIFVDRISATYYAGGGSGAGLGAAADSSIKRRATEHLFAKWLPLLSPQECAAIGNLHHQTLQKLTTACATIAQRDQALAEKDQALAEKDQALAEKDQALAEKDQALAALYASRSWIITQPLRWCGAAVRQAIKSCTALLDKIRRSGGTRVASGKLFRILATEGLHGIQNRLSVIQEQAADYNDYRLWQERYDTCTKEESDRLLAKIPHITQLPLISVVMPVYNPPPSWLVEAIESVRNQIYPNWELCIADDASTDPEIRAVLQRYTADDPRIKVIFRETNGHISAASNSALELATGEWVALLDQDDLLSPQALFRVAEAIDKQPDLKLIYSDEDKIDEDGRRFDPYFKSEFNYQLFLCQNMVSHLGVYHTKTMRQVGGFRKGFEGSQDYDLALRIVEALRPGQICHIPRVLYHWRCHLQSTASGGDAKPYASRAALRAVEEHLQRTGKRAVVEQAPLARGQQRVRYLLPSPASLVEIIMPAGNQAVCLKRSISSILSKTDYPSYLVTVIDSGPGSPETRQLVEQWADNPRIRIVQGKPPFHLPCLNNQAVANSAADYVCLVSNGIEIITPDWLTEMTGHALQPGVGAVGAKLLCPVSNTILHGGFILGVRGIAGHAHKGWPQGCAGYFGKAALQQEVSGVTAACLLVSRRHYLDAGGMDEQNLSLTFHDLDLCLKLRENGLRNIWTPHALLYHHRSTGRVLEHRPEDTARFVSERDYLQQRWGTVLSNDPYYSPNLTLEREDFSLAWPPRIFKCFLS